MFKDLIADLTGLAAASNKGGTLAKSAGADAADANIQTAGATGGDSGDGGEGAAGDGAAGAAGAGGDGAGGDGAGDVDGDGDGDDAPMAKSFEVTLEGGEKFHAVDATDMLKSLTARMEDVETSAGEALGLAVTLLKSQAAEISDLRGRVEQLAGSGRGRQATLVIVPKDGAPAAGGSTLTKSLTPGEQDKGGMKPQEFLLKAEAAFDASKLTGNELGQIETYINRGMQIPAPLIQKVMAAQPAA